MIIQIQFIGRIITYFFIVILILASCKATPPLVKVVKEMAAYKTFEYKFTGLADDSSLQWARYETILANSTDDDLVQLCENVSPVVRSYAFMGLIEKKSPQIFEILLKHIKDTGKFDRVMGCMVNPCYVSDFYLEQVGYFPYDSTWYTISSQQREYLDSLMLFGPEVTLRGKYYNAIELRSREHMLKTLLIKTSYYSRLREIVSEGVFEALPALATFKNPEDVSLIKQVYVNERPLGDEYVFDAIKNFPHPDLYDIIEREVKNDLRHDNSYDRRQYKFYKALIQYKTTYSKELLSRSIALNGSENQKRRVKSIKTLISTSQK